MVWSVSRPLPPDQLFPAHRTDIAQRFVDLPSGVRLRIAEAGPPDGDPVLLIHGWGASLYMYRHALDALPRLGKRAIAVDLRGFGLSSRVPRRGAYSLDEYIGDLLALLDRLELSRPAIIGQSMGGGLTLRFALRHEARVSRIVLINPSSLVPIRFIPVIRTLPRAVAAALGGRIVPRWAISFTLRWVAYARASAVTTQDVDEYWSPTQLPGYTAAARGALGDFDWSVVSNGEAQRLAVPTLVMLGSQDRLIANTERAARRLKDAQICTLDGGHCVHEENPTAAYRVIGEFL